MTLPPLASNLAPLAFCLRLPAVDRNIDRLTRGIVNPHFSETTISGFFRCVALGARCTGGL